MPFKFAYICDLLEKLESFEARNTPLLNADKVRHVNSTIDIWFKQHRRLVDAPDTDRVALLSTLFPERRTDRVYYLKENGLVKVLARCLGLGRDRLNALEAWKPSNPQDLALLVSNVLRATDAGGSGRSITVEDIDAVLGELASRCRFSGPQVRAARSTDVRDLPDKVLRPILIALSSRDLKWFIRLVLKRFVPVVLEEQFVLRKVHFLLPRVLKFQGTFAAAIQVLDDPSFVKAMVEPSLDMSPGAAAQFKAQHMRPQIGTKVGRPEFVKARSLKHCLNIAGKQRWAIESKYDGEYCQVHVDLSKGNHCIQIFSKSGKDSTKDRIALRDWIMWCLKIGQQDCKIRNRCILEGEMVVYDDTTKTILDFHKIRKHIKRSGTYIGTKNDSPAHAHEHLMMIFFDVLMIDDDIVMAQPYEQRRQKLRSMIHYYPGWCQTAEWGILDFGKLSTKKAIQKLERSFAKAIAWRCEGLILKPCDRPYFSLNEPKDDGKIIKLKKDYIPGLGDTADFAIVGASYNAAEAPPNVKNVKYTSFVLACLLNKENVCRFKERPEFKVMGMLTRPCIPIPDMHYISQHGQFYAEDYKPGVVPSKFDLEKDAGDGTIDVVFKKPFLVDVLGSSFEKPSGKNYYMLRHPRISKLHRDRGYEDVVSFNELQDMAIKARSVPDDLIREEQEWLAKLRKTHNLYDENSNTTVSQTTTESPGSKRTTPCGKKAASFPVAADSSRATDALFEALGRYLKPGQQLPRPIVNATSVLPTPPTSSLPVPQGRSHSKSVTPTSHLGKRKRSDDEDRGHLENATDRKHGRQTQTAVTYISPPHPLHCSSQPNDRRVLADITNSPPKPDPPHTTPEPEQYAPSKHPVTKRSVRFDETPEHTRASRAARLAANATIPSTPTRVVQVTVERADAFLPQDQNNENAALSLHAALNPPTIIVSNAAPATNPLPVEGWKPSEQISKEAESTESTQSWPSPPPQPFTPTSTVENSKTSSTIRIAPPSPTFTSAISRPTPTSPRKENLNQSALLNPLQNHSFHLSPCISRTPYLTQNLLPVLFSHHSNHLSQTSQPSDPYMNPLIHTTYITPCLSHWSRSLRPSVPPQQVRSPGDRNIIPESQAYEGLQKALLIEPRRQAQSQTLIQCVINEIQLAEGEEVQVWDWRVVEDVVDILGLLPLKHAGGERREGPAGAENDGGVEMAVGAVTGALAAALAETGKEEMEECLRRHFVGVVKVGRCDYYQDSGGPSRDRGDTAGNGNMWEPATESDRWTIARRVLEGNEHRIPFPTLPAQLGGTTGQAITPSVPDTVDAASCQEILYFLNNNPSGCDLVSVCSSRDETLKAFTFTTTAGNGMMAVNDGYITPLGPDCFFSQGSVILYEDLRHTAAPILGTMVLTAPWMLFTVNPGSNTVVMFDISSPVESVMVGHPVNFLGQSPVSVAYSATLHTDCVLNGGAIAGVSCYSVDPENGVMPLDKTLRPIPLPFHQTTPSVGPLGTVSQTSFTPDSAFLMATVKGTIFAPGQVLAWPTVNNTVSHDPIPSFPSGDVLPFGFGFLWNAKGLRSLNL